MISAEVNHPFTSIRHKKKGFAAVVHLKNVDALFFLFLREKQFLDGGEPRHNPHLLTRHGSPPGVTKLRLLLPYRERMIIYWRLLRRCFAALGWDFCPIRLDEKNVSKSGQGRVSGIYCNWKGVEKLRLVYASWRD